MRSISFVVLVLSLVPLSAQAQWDSGPSDREGRWETSFGLYLTGSESASGLNESSVDIDDGLGFGFRPCISTPPGSAPTTTQPSIPKTRAWW